VRRVLNVESGLNDGIAAPVVTVAIVLAAVGDLSGMHPIVDALRELALAAVVGAGIGGAGRWLLIRAEIRGTVTSSSTQLTTLALAIGAYFIATGLESSGFIAAFAAGLAFGMGHKERAAAAVAFTESQSVLLSILVWLVFGLVVFSEHIVTLSDPMVIAYAILSLTAARMIPVALSWFGTRLDPVTTAFVGWFGPRGLASVVFVLLALESLETAGVPTGPLGPVVAWTVILSVVAHGFSARPLAAWYGRYATVFPEDSPELLGDEEPYRRPAWTFHGRRDHDVSTGAG
jgi:NhaP-type Na+/H+ or K+/H+ antiporter